MNEEIQAPRPIHLLGEARGLFEFSNLLLESRRLARQPKGQGQPVLVLPGFGASDASTAVLRAYVRYLGYRPRGWGLGRNTGDVPALLARVVEQLDQFAAEERQPVALIGWSLGGVLAREAARERPAAARLVITLGSPVVGGPKYTAAAAYYRRQGFDLDDIEAQVAARNERPIETPITAIYSRSDAVVAWRACIDRHAPNVDHVEVESTHLGLGFSPRVFEIIAERLARPQRPGRRGCGGASAAGS